VVVYRTAEGKRVDPYGRPVTPEKPASAPEEPTKGKAPRKATKAREGKQAARGKAQKGG